MIFKYKLFLQIFYPHDPYPLNPTCSKHMQCECLCQSKNTSKVIAFCIALYSVSLILYCRFNKIEKAWFIFNVFCFRVQHAIGLCRPNLN